MTRRSTILFLVVGLAVLSAAPASARTSGKSSHAAELSPAISATAPDIIGFESDTSSGKADPFTSVHNPTVHFVDTITANLNVYDAGGESNGKGLGIFSDDASALLILLDVPTTRLSIRVGNDHPSVVLPGDRATLTLYRNGDQVARRHVTLNDNDLGDQFIQYQGRVAIDRATLVYNRAGTPLALIEVVDDIALAQVCAIRGNRRANTLNGNAGPNGICGLNGRDRIRGHGGNDALFGGGGVDNVNGNDGNDLVVGGGGDDTLNAADGVPGNDAVYGGPGNDTCTADANDLLVDCENSVVVPTARRASARQR